MRIILATVALSVLLCFQVEQLYGPNFFTSMRWPIEQSAMWFIYSILLCLYIVIQSIWSLQKSKHLDVTDKSNEPTKKTHDNSNTTASNKPLSLELKQADETLRALKIKLKESQDKHDALKVECSFLKEETAKFKRLAEGRSRDSIVDAEIVNLLAILQEKGRFIDFVMDDITPYNDAQVGVVARVVHQGCKDVIKEYFDINPIHKSNEGERIVLEEGFAKRAYRLMGNISNKPPYAGVVIHRGWEASTVRLPRLIQNDDRDNSENNSSQESLPHKIIAPAQVEA